MPQLPKTNNQRKPKSLAPQVPATSTAGAPATAGRKRWFFRLIATLVVPLVLLVSVEGVLRLVGYGYSPRFFQNRRINGHEVWTDNPDFGRRFFRSGLVRYPHPFTMPATKAPKALRIFVLGESAAMGDPDVKFGLPRMLEVLLRERFPDRRIEVINTAIVAITSHVILPIARDCARKDGDLWIIYMGNNEIIGPFGSASVFGAQAPPLPVIRAGLWVKATRLGQLLDGALHLVSRRTQRLHSWGGMEMMADQKARHNSPATARVYQHFAQNLSDMLATGARAGVPIVLCTVATNLRDCAPFASLHRADLAASDRAQWQAAYDAGVGCQKQGNLAEAKAAFERAAKIDDEYADMSFRRAECCRLLGLEAEAVKLFRQARDQDALQFRADGRINEIIRSSAAAFADRRVSLLDAEGLFATNSPQALPGAEFFYEHVHLTPEGNYLLARALAEQVVQALLLEPVGQWLSQPECFRLLGLTDGSRYDAFEVILDRIQGAPFTNQVDYAQELQRVNEQLAHYRVGTKPAQVRRDLQQVLKLVDRHPEDPELRWIQATLLESAGDIAGAEAQWRTLAAMQPHAALPAINLARTLERLGRRPEAYPLYAAGLRINPEYYPARYALGLLCLRMDRLPEAIHHLGLTADQKPQSLEPRLALSQALARAHRLPEAETELREVLRVDPNNASAQTQLRELSNMSGGR